MGGFNEDPQPPPSNHTGHDGPVGAPGGLGGFNDGPRERFSDNTASPPGWKEGLRELLEWYLFSSQSVDVEVEITYKPVFDIGANQAFKIPTSFRDFHNLEIVDYPNDALNSDLFDEWKTVTNNSVIHADRCVGYKIPLFLNGEDTVENLKDFDMEVYWELLGQVIRKNMFKTVE